MASVIRPLSQQDLDAWCSLREEAHAEFPASFGPSLTDDLAQRLETYRIWLEKSQIWGAFDTDQKLSGVIGFYPEKSHLMQHRGTIFSFYVQKEARAHHVGQALLETAISYAKNRGISQIHLCVMTVLAPAIALYEKFDFKTIGLIERSVLIKGQPYDEKLMMRTLS